MTLLPFERRVLCAIFETMLPSGADPRLPLGAADVPMDRFADELLHGATRPFGFALRACTWAVWLVAPLVYVGRARVFTGLREDERTELFERMSRSPAYFVREVPVLFKTAACLGFCGLPDVQKAVGVSPRDATPPAWAEPPGSPRCATVARAGETA